MISEIKSKIATGIAILIISSVSLFAYNFYQTNRTLTKELEDTKKSLVYEKKVNEVLLLDLSNALKVNDANQKVIEEMTTEIDAARNIAEELDRENAKNKKKFEDAKKNISEIKDGLSCEVSPVIKAAVIEIQKIRGEK